MNNLIQSTAAAVLRYPLLIKQLLHAPLSHAARRSRSSTATCGATATASSASASAPGRARWPRWASSPATPSR